MTNLTINSIENVVFMVEEIKTKLRMVNSGAFQGKELSNDDYEDLQFIYEMVAKKSHFSIAEVDAIAKELGTLFNK